MHFFILPSWVTHEYLSSKRPNSLNKKKELEKVEQSWVLLGNQDLKFVTKYIISEAPSAPEH